MVYNKINKFIAVNHSSDEKESVIWMPLVPTKDKSIPSRQSQTEKQLVNFMASKPKYQLSDLVLSGRNLDELQTVIKAKEYWNKVFVDWVKTLPYNEFITNDFDDKEN